MAEDVIWLKKDGVTITVSPLGGAVLSAEWHGTPFLKPTPSPGLASQRLGAEACFPLVPFGNRIEKNAFRFGGRDYTLTPNTADPLVLHGDCWLTRWTLLAQKADEIILGCRQEPNGASPFSYEATQTVSIFEDTLALSLTVTNMGAQALPFGLGFHPYFPRTPATSLTAYASHCWSEREDHLPGSPQQLSRDLNVAVGTTLPDRWLNNAFDGWDGRAWIKWPETGLALRLKATGLDRFVIYSPSAADGFFCFEPMSHRPNAHHQQSTGGLFTLSEGSSQTVSITMSCTFEA